MIKEFLFQGTVLEFPSAFFPSTFLKMTSCLPQKQHFGIVFCITLVSLLKNASTLENHD